MRGRGLLLAGFTLPALSAFAQNGSMQLPKSVTAGSAFTIPTSGSGTASLYLVGPGQAIKREVTLGQGISFVTGDLYSAGHYLAVLSTGGSSQTEELDVVPTSQPGSLGFLAKPSRLPVGMRNGISGAVYVFDAYHNLITTPMPASLQLESAPGSVQTRNVTTHHGLAWASMDSDAKKSAARFVARVGPVSSTRIIDQVPGDPCSISISATAKGNRLAVQTAPVHDCGGNAIPDGTIVTFTETYGTTQSTVDVPLKQGVASVEMPATRGAKISAASGVVAGNEIRWEGR